MRTPGNLLLRIGTGIIWAAALPAQEPDTAGRKQLVQAPGPHYRAGGLHRLLLGREYRSLWTTPVAVPVLDLARFAGGLRPVSRGGGQQTRSLLLVSPDGREFFFRSVDKDPSATLPPELQGTVAGRVVRDQTSSAFPTAPLVVAPLLGAAGILHGRSWFYVLPHSTRLAEFEEEFAGMIGFLEERVGGPGGPAAHWAGASEIIGTDSLVARMAQGPDDQVDARALLKARLFDLLIGDWDRHADQWVWVSFGDSLPRRWLPVPRDRDQAFVKYDGALLSIARQSAPQLTNFGPKYPYIPGATWNGRDLDRRFLTELEWPVWESVVNELRGALTDPVIDRAVRSLPQQHYQVAGTRLTAALRLRRDRLAEAARRYYRMLAAQVDVHASAASDQAYVSRQEDGSVELTLSERGGSSTGGRTYFRRRFDPGVTREIRLFLGDGDDRVIVAGRGGPLVRVLGGGGDDELVDSAPGGGERFYDDPGAPARTSGLASRIDRRPYAPPNSGTGALPPRDWGRRWVASTMFSAGPDLGLLIGGGRTLMIYGFRKYPFAGRHRFRAGFATGPMSYRLDYQGEFRRENSRGYLEVKARASGIDIISFHGFGNEIPAPGENEFYRVTQDAVGLAASLVFPLGARGFLSAGPVLRYASTDRRPDRFLATLGNLYGTGNFGEVGGRITARFDSRDQPSGATSGFFVEVGGAIYPPLWDVDSTFGELRGEAATYLTAPIGLRPTLALRVGGRKLWGPYPFFEAAFIGGASTVRLGRLNRFAGDAATYGSAELRLPLAKVNLVVPAELGVFGLTDVGRVFLRGESSDQWHTAVGGGLSLSFLSRANTLTVAVAGGEERAGVYLQAGFGF